MYKLFPYFNNQNLLRLLSKYPASAGLSQRWHWKTQSCLAFSPAFSLPSFYYKSLCENMGDQTWKSIKLNSNFSCWLSVWLLFQYGKSRTPKTAFTDIAADEAHKWGQVLLLTQASSLYCSVYFLVLYVCPASFSCMCVTLPLVALSSFTALQYHDSDKF